MHLGAGTRDVSADFHTPMGSTSDYVGDPAVLLSRPTRVQNISHPPCYMVVCAMGGRTSRRRHVAARKSTPFHFYTELRFFCFKEQLIINRLDLSLSLVPAGSTRKRAEA
jgi:hypothetical protein